MRPPTPLPPLTDDQLAAYRTDGFVRLGRILDPPTLERLRAEEARLRPERDPHAPGARTLFRNQVCPFSAPVRTLATQGAHLGWTTQILGPNVLFWWVQFVTKLPDPAGSPSGIFHWHQDCGYQDVAPLPMTIWIALDATTEENGCIWVVPGSHHRGLLPHAQRPDSWHLEVPVPGPGVSVPLAAGEAVAFTGYTLHRSLANRTAAPRRALFLEYTHADAVHPARGHELLRASPDAWLVAGEASEQVAPRPVPAPV